METIKFRFELNNKPNRESLYEVFLVISERGGKKSRIKTEVFVKKEHFGTFKDIVTTSREGKKGIINKRVLVPDKWITSKDHQATFKNDKLSKKILEYRKNYEAKKETDNYVNPQAIIKAVETKYMLRDVVAVLNKKRDELKDDYPNLKGYSTLYMHLITFLNKEYKSTVVDFRHIDRKFLMKLEAYLRNALNSDGSVHTVLKRLRALFNYAIANDIISPNIYPFKTYKLPYITPKYKERLSREDLIQFEKQQYEVGSYIFWVQQAFLLSVRMAGVRVEDLMTLRVKNVAKGRITYNMSKGVTKGRLKSILITDKIQVILDNCINEKSKPNDLLFPFVSPAIDTYNRNAYKKEIGSKTAILNKYLKMIANDACISAHVTTHIARHSFANLALKHTKDIKAIQEALGHSDSKTTQIYLDELNIENQDDMMQAVNL